LALHGNQSLCGFSPQTRLGPARGPSRPHDSSALHMRKDLIKPASPWLRAYQRLTRRRGAQSNGFTDPFNVSWPRPIVFAIARPMRYHMCSELKLIADCLASSSLGSQSSHPRHVIAAGVTAAEQGPVEPTLPSGSLRLAGCSGSTYGITTSHEL
jgi:hypothetical protein